ncbi:unnamed protein product [Blumeria hordei]|uniref:Peptidyl-prolyl cis-trans isomerase n=1 Tax=Blumeria hordei TaxID=2867405 RepID=A0A383V1M2_BLUHO|nr:unnamed protein product [Blumeria hordei]
MESTHNCSVVFFDVSVDDRPAGRIVFKLYVDVAPVTAEIFRSLCTGERSCRRTQKPLSYKDSTFHRVIKNCVVQGGNIIGWNGFNREFIKRYQLEDETPELEHDRPFLLSMANSSSGLNRYRFLITTVPAPHLNGIQVVFGEVIQGRAIVNLIESLPTLLGFKPCQEVKVTNCGELTSAQAEVARLTAESSIRGKIKNYRF